MVSYTQTGSTFTVSWDGVPEFPDAGSNSFSITLRDNSNRCVAMLGDDDSRDDPHGDDDGRDDDDDHRGGPDVSFSYTSLTAQKGIVGVTGGLATTNGVEEEVDLSQKSRNGRKTVKVDSSGAVYEFFKESDFDLDGQTLKFRRLGKALRDRFEPNDSLKRASKIAAPFDTVDTRHHYSSIDPEAADVDFYRFTAEAGKYLVAEVTRGQIDSVLGLYYCPPTGNGDDDSSDDDSDDRGGMKPDKCDTDTAIEIDFNDDSGGTLLSRIESALPVDGTYALAVTFCCDYDFDGVDPGQGAPFDGGRYVLELKTVDGTLLTLGDDDSEKVPFGFDFPFQGRTYNDVFVNSNGNLTFGSGNTFFNPLVADFLFLEPRISPLWEDLNPGAGGLIFYKEGTDCLKVSFQDVPEFPAAGANSFSVAFDSAGNIQFDYGDLTETGGLSGITEGGGAADPGEGDLSTGGPFPVSGTTYEFFSDLGDNDLSGTSVVFGNGTTCGSDNGSPGGDDDDDDDYDDDDDDDD